MNTVNIIARLTREPEVKFTPNGKQITTFSIAYDMGFGENKRACFLDCKLWGDRGENFVKYVKKGHAVALTGALDMESWQDKQSQQKRSKHVLDVRDFTLLSNKREGENEEGPATRQARPAPQPARRPPPRQDDDFGIGPISDGMEEDEIPF